MIKQLLYLVFLLAAALASCSRNDSTIKHPDGNGQGATRLKRPHGAPLGPAATKEIGTGGGSLSSADGRLTLQVPAGAISTTVTFSIQQVENTLEGSPAKAYRLLPEDLSFTQPVSLRYTLDESELTATVPDALYLAYQNKEGYHYLAVQTELQTATNTLTVKTNHFSDWTVAELLEVVADTTQVSPGGKANLRLMWHLGSLLGPFTEDPALGALSEYDGYVSKVNWSLASGKGSIQADGIRCSYTAPNSVPTENPAFVSVSVPFTQYNSRRQGLAILTTPILTVPDEYLMVSVDGQPAINKAPENGYTWLNMEADKFYVSATLQDDHNIYILIPGGVTGTGTYPYGDQEKQAYIDYSTDDNIDNSYISEKRNCETCDRVFSGGQVKITKFGSVGEYVEGEFTAEVWLMGYYNPPKKNLVGKFRVKRNF